VIRGSWFVGTIFDSIHEARITSHCFQMSRILTASALLVLLCAVSSANVQHHKKQQKPSPAVASQPQATPVAAPQTPPQPATPENGPSSPPDVKFQGGQLTIVARNSTMGDVLNAVRQKTGAAVDMPAASGERVVGQFGPGAPREVMAQLLNGSHYDYVLLGSPADPQALKKIVLMAKASGPEPAPQNQTAQQQPNENVQQVPDVTNDNTEENNGEATANGQPAEEEAQPEQPEQSEQPDQSDQQQPVVKTPEQLLRELQQQQQQQQQQQDQPPPPGAPGQPPQ